MILLFVSTISWGQTRYYFPYVETDTSKVSNILYLQGDTFRLATPADGQILKRVSGVWMNADNEASVFDSITWNAATGVISVWKNGSVFDTVDLDGRYLTSDSLSDVMLISVYDTANVSEQVVGINHSQTLSNKTLILPVIANFTNAQHDHSTAAQGDTINSDNILEGSTNLFSQWSYVGGGNIRYMDGDVGLGGSPTNLLDVFGTARVEILDVSSSFRMDGLTLTDINTGASDNANLVTKGYVDDAISAAGGYTDEQAQDAVGAIVDTSSVSDVKFNYNDGTPLLSATVKDDSHNHTGTTISGLAVADFTSPNVSNWTNDANYVGSSFAMTNDLSGTLANPAVVDDSHNHTISTLPNIVASVDGVVNDGGDIDLVASGAVTITPNDGANTITIGSTDSQNLSMSKVGNNVTISISGGTGTTFTVADGDSLTTNEIQLLTLTNDTLHLSRSGGDVKLPSGADNWGTQYVKLNSDSLLKGRGTTASPLKIDTAKIATQYDITGTMQSLTKSKAGNNVTVDISGGTGTTFSVADGDSLTNNELNTAFGYTASTRVLNITDAGASRNVTLPTFSTSSTDPGLVTGSSGAGASVFLNGNGAWAVPSGAGNVSKVGTPSNDQVGVWTGDGTIEGDADLTFNGTKLTATQLYITTPTAGSGDYDKFLVLDATGTEVKTRTGAEVLSDIGGQSALTTGNLTESVTGLQFDNTRQVIGGAAALSLTSGYVIPTTTEQAQWAKAYIHTHTNDQDSSATNEIQNLSKSKVGNNVTVNISSGTGTTFSVADADSSTTNEIQNLSKSKAGNNVTVNISSGTGTTFSVADGDSLTNNELNTSVLYTPSTKIFSITDAGGTKGDTIPTFSTTSVEAGLVTGSSGNTTKFLRGDNTWQTVVTSEGDASSTNEIQNLSKSKTGNDVTVNISGGTGTTFSVADADSSITNELQNLSKSKAGNNVTVNISGGTGTTFSVADSDSLTNNELNTAFSYTASTRILNITDPGASRNATLPPFSTSSVEYGLVPGSSGAGATVFLNGNGSWSVPAGAGNMSKVGTPVNDQIGIWTGDGTMEGVSNLTFNGTKLSTEKLYISSPTAGSSDYDKFLVLDASGTEVKTRTGVELLSDIGGQSALTTGDLTEYVTGLQFSNTRQVIGGATALSLTSGYVIPTTTEQAQWNKAYTHTHTNDQDSSATNEIQNLSYTASTRVLAIDGSGSADATLPAFSTTGTDYGLVPGSSGAGATVFLNGNGGWTTPSGNDNWGTQYVITDNTLTGQGTSGSTLKVDTAKIATQYDLVTSGASGWVDGGAAVNLATSSDYVGVGTTGNSSYKLYVYTTGINGSRGVNIFNSGDNSYGIYSFNSGTGTTYGIHTIATSTSGIGVSGRASNSSGTTYGVKGAAESASGYAGYFANTATSGNAYGLYASTGSSSGYAGYFSGNVQSTGNILSSAGHVGTNGTYPLQLTDDGYVYFSNITAPSAPVSGTGYLYVAGTSGSEKIYFKNNGATYDLTSGGTGMTNPMTTTGDIIYSSSGSTPARLGIGSTGQVLTVSGGIPSWQTLAGGGNMSTSTYDSNSDGIFTVPNGGTGLSSLTAYALMAGGTTSTGNMQQVSGLGTSGQVLTSNGTGSLPTWQTFSASPAGSGTELQYKNGSAFGAVSGTSISGSDVSFTGNVLSSAGSVGCNGSNPIGLTTSGYAYLPNISAPSAPTSGLGYLYIAGTTGSEHIYFKNQNEAAYDLTTGTGGSGDMTKATYDNSGTADIIDVENGGTGLSSYTTYRLLASGTTSTGNFQQLDAGSSGQVLTSQGAGSLPVWQTFSGTSHDPVTLGTTNGLSLSTQQLSLGLASGSSNGALSSTDWTTFNNKLSSEVDGSTTNEIQNLSKSKVGNNVTVNISSGTGTTFSVADSDSSTTNELQNVSYTASTRAVAISGGTGFTFPIFTNSADGLVPLSGGGTSNFLRADGTWTTPSGAGDMLKATYDTNADNKIDLAAGGTGVATFDAYKLLIGTTGNYIGQLSSAGTSGQALLSNGASANPSWQDIGWTDAGTYIYNTTTTDEVRVGGTTDNGSYIFQVNGTSYFSGAVTGGSTFTGSNFILSSDQRLKENIKPLSDLKWVDDIQLFSFNMKGDKAKRYGVIAQQIFKVNPELVRIDKDGLYSVAYTDYLIAKVARQDEKIKSLEERIEKLEKLIK